MIIQLRRHPYVSYLIATRGDKSLSREQLIQQGYKYECKNGHLSQKSGRCMVLHLFDYDTEEERVVGSYRCDELLKPITEYGMEMKRLFGG
jgi:hypothetical protein